MAFSHDFVLILQFLTKIRNLKAKITPTLNIMIMMSCYQVKDDVIKTF